MEVKGEPRLCAWEEGETVGTSMADVGLVILLRVDLEPMRKSLVFNVEFEAIRSYLRVFHVFGNGPPCVRVSLHASLLPCLCFELFGLLVVCGCV